MDFIGSIPVIGSPAFTIIVFIVALSVIIAVHEYGHYIVGRWCGIHADVFSLGFGPVLFSRVDKRGTKWQVAALPFGGYVKFLGDADASSVTADEGFLDHLADVERQKELRRTMLGAPVWARAATVAAGPIFNFILGAFIFTGTFLYYGKVIEPPTVGSLVDLPPSVENQLQPGDTILAIEGQDTSDFDAFNKAIEELPISPGVDYRISRDGREETVRGPWPFPAYIGSLHPNSAGIDAGLKLGDVIVSVDGTPIGAFKELPDIVAASAGDELVLGVWRAGETKEFRLSPRLTDLPKEGGGYEQRWLIGFSGGLLFEPATGPVGIGEAFSSGVKNVGSIMRDSLTALYNVAIGTISECNIRGPIGMAEIARDMAKQGLVTFINFIALLSVAVGLINLFPIPVLDGGHLVFHAWEAITRRPPPERAVRVLMTTGLVIILAFMSFALFNDIRCP